MVGDGGDAEATTRQMIDQCGRGPGAVGSVGVQVEIDRVRRCERQRLRWRCRSRDLVGGSARRVCQGESSRTRGMARRLMLPGSLTDAARRTPRQLSGMRLTCGYHRSVPTAPRPLRHPVQRFSQDDHNGAMRPCAWRRRQTQESRVACGRIGHRGFLERVMNSGGELFVLRRGTT
jgi:hypothetical protein